MASGQRDNTIHAPAHRPRVAGPRICCLIVASLILLCFSNAAQAETRLYTARHYLIHSDIASSAIVEDLATRMDAMFDEYARRLANFQPAVDEPQLEAYIFQTRAEYLRFTQHRMENTGGVFLPAQHCFAAFLEEQGLDSLRRTIQHEAFHQFALSAIGPGLPTWLNEGLAQFFEESPFTGTHFLVGQVPPWRVRQLHADMNAHKLVDFTTFLAITPDQWAQRMTDRAEGATEYNQAWAMVQMLIEDCDENGRPRYRDRLLQMLTLLKNGAHADGAFTRAFSANIQGFQDRFVEYAGALAPTPQAATIENQDILCDMILELQKSGQRFATVDSLRDAAVSRQFRIQYTRGLLTWTTDPNPAIYFSDADHHLLGPNQLFFLFRDGATLPDLVRRDGSLELQSHFDTDPDGRRGHDTTMRPRADR